MPAPRAGLVRALVLSSSLLAVAVMMATACAREGGDLERRLAGAIGRGAPVDIRTVTDFDWDRLFVFAPYTPVAEMRRCLGFEWPEAGQSGIERRDDIALLVFVRGGRVVRALEFPRRSGDFSGVPGKEGLSPQQAVFEVRRGTSGPVLALSGQAAR